MYNVVMKRLLAIGLLLSVVSAAFAQTPASADALIASATRTGMKTGKTVFVRFTASWCGWCHKMQSVLDRPDVKPIWDKYFVSQPIVVLENGEKEALENAGGEELMKKQGGEGQGIPYFYFMDPKTGKTLANSLMPAAEGKKPANVGCPYQPEEIAFFMKLLEKAAPKMTAAERTTIEEGFKALSKKG